MRTVLRGSLDNSLISPSRDFAKCTASSFELTAARAQVGTTTRRRRARTLARRRPRRTARRIRQVHWVSELGGGEVEESTEMRGSIEKAAPICQSSQNGMQRTLHVEGLSAECERSAATQVPAAPLPTLSSKSRRSVGGTSLRGPEHIWRRRIHGFWQY